MHWHPRCCLYQWAAIQATSFCCVVIGVVGAYAVLDVVVDDEVEFLVGEAVMQGSSAQ